MASEGSMKTVAASAYVEQAVAGTQQYARAASLRASNGVSAQHIQLAITNRVAPARAAGSLIDTPRAG